MCVVATGSEPRVPQHFIYTHHPLHGRIESGQENNYIMISNYFVSIIEIEQKSMEISFLAAIM